MQRRERTDAPLRVDANCGWTASNAASLAVELPALGVEFIEQPLPPEDHTAQKQLFQEISSLLIKSQKLDSKGIACRDIVAAAVERERLGSTGVGNGVALPHARLEGIDHVTAVFVKLATPLKFDSVDDRDVDLVAFLLAPENAGGSHLRALAKVSFSKSN